jgi:hypothetical protein
MIFESRFETVTGLLKTDSCPLRLPFGLKTSRKPKVMTLQHTSQLYS